MIRLDICKTEHDIDCFFEGMKQGIGMLWDHPRKNVNTGEPLKFEEMLSDLAVFKKSALFLIKKPESPELPK